MECILVRSLAERATLLHKLPIGIREQYEDKVRVARRAGIYFSWYTGVEFVDVDGGELRIRLSDRRDGREVETHFCIMDYNTSAVRKQTTTWKASTRNDWVWTHDQPPGTYLLRIVLERVVAYEAPFIVS